MNDRKFLNRYFRSIHDKVEADALLFNQKLPHTGLAGSENEQVIGNVIRDFLPPRFGVEIGALVIDRHGNVSKQCDIVIFDAQNFPKYFRKVFPIELVYCVIEVKTLLSSQQAGNALENLMSLKQLDFMPALTPYWETKTKEENLLHYPPLYSVFGYRSDTNCFETFAKWFPRESVYGDAEASSTSPSSLLVGVLDQGIIRMDRSNRYVQRWVAEADPETRQKVLETKAYDKPVFVDPAKSLFVYLESLWVLLWTHRLHPGFDIRTYMDQELEIFIEISDERMSEFI